MEIRPAREDEATAVADLLTEAFADGGEVAAVWADVLARGFARASLVAVDPGDPAGRGDTARVVGHVGLSHAWLDARRELVDVLVLSPLGVRRGRQGGGIGTALVAAAIDVAERLGAPAVFLEGSPHYYGRRGFESAAARGFEAPTRRTPAPAFQVIVLSSHENWMTGRVVYRDVWWEHDAAGLRDPDLSEVERALGP